MTRSEALYVLGLKPGASDEEAKKAWRNLVKLTHPDKDRSHDAARRFEKVQTAYQTIIETEAIAAQERRERKDQKEQAAERAREEYAWRQPAAQQARSAQAARQRVEQQARYAQTSRKRTGLRKTIVDDEAAGLLVFSVLYYVGFRLLGSLLNSYDGVFTGLAIITSIFPVVVLWVALGTWKMRTSFLILSFVITCVILVFLPNPFPNQASIKPSATHGAPDRAISDTEIEALLGIDPTNLAIQEEETEDEMYEADSPEVEAMMDGMVADIEKEKGPNIGVDDVRSDLAKEIAELYKDDIEAGILTQEEINFAIEAAIKRLKERRGIADDFVANDH